MCKVKFSEHILTDHLTKKDWKTIKRLSIDPRLGDYMALFELHNLPLSKHQMLGLLELKGKITQKKDKLSPYKISAMLKAGGSPYRLLAINDEGVLPAPIYRMVKVFFVIWLRPVT